MGLTREQALCIETLDRPLVVAAGAGSGKTFTLTKRIAGAFEGKPPHGPFVNDIDEICAITFTNKAAGELKSRIKAELRARNRVDQALRVDDAWISTIHSMCARILRSHAVELEIDPSFKVAEQAQLEEYRARAIDEVLAEVGANPSPAVDALFAEYGARSTGGFGNSVEKMLGTLVKVAATQPDGVDGIVLQGTTMAPEIIVERAVQIVEGFVTEAKDCKASKTRDAWLAETEDALEAARDLLSRGVRDCESAFGAVARLKLSKQFGSGDFKARVDEGRLELGFYIMEARIGAASAHLETLVMLGRRVVGRIEGYKRADGVLDNNDLLVMAARALEEHPTIAAHYAHKFKLVMVDEFQDTDQMQVDMIKRLAGEGAERLCTVGDAQQSIYRFRGADVSVYRKHLHSVQESWSDSVIKLSKNFRSHGDVLAFVDRVFEKPAMFGGEFMSLGHGRAEGEVKKPFAGSSPRIVVQHTSRPYHGGVGARLVEVAAQRIADEFAKLEQAGHKPNEMVVLLRRMKYADVYARALRDRGLPCVVSGGSVFASMEETQIALQLAHVMANPHNTQALLQVLISPLFSLTAGDLLRVGGIEGFWQAAFAERAEAGDASPQLACALRVMAAARRKIGDMPVSRIMYDVLADSGWLSRRQAEGAEGLASAANALKAVRMVEGIERSGAVGPSSVAFRLADALAHSKEAPGALSVSGGDSVRIMTIHSSKGLEFPIVAVSESPDDAANAPAFVVSTLAGTSYASLDLGQTLTDVYGNKKPKIDDLRDYVLGDVAGEEELAAVVAGKDDAVCRRLALLEHEKAAEAEEAKRLLYVALTRAREALVVSTMGDRTKANPTGVPQNAFAGVFAALDPLGIEFASGRGEYEFGGETKAVLECEALEADELDEQDGEAPAEIERAFYLVPAPEEALNVTYETYKPLHRDVFSYSSISDAAHEGDVLERLAEAHAVSVDTGLASEYDAFAPAGAQSAGLAAENGLFSSPPASFDDDFWDFDVSQAFDEDRATDLGTAFHRLAQYAVVARGGNGPLAMPPADRVEALSRTCNLDAEQQMRLGIALQRWFGCDEARAMAASADLSAEVPFFVAVPSEGESAYLEGEIDLLAFDEAREHATVVDYKTGGRDDETPDDLRRKHVLQAACYAYAIMLQGVASVEALFVRVERGRADDPDQPQCVRYRFKAADIPALAKAIADVYGQGG